MSPGARKKVSPQVPEEVGVEGVETSLPGCAVGQEWAKNPARDCLLRKRRAGVPNDPRQTGWAEKLGVLPPPPPASLPPVKPRELLKVTNCFHY